MLEDEFFSEFYAKLDYIVNFRFNIGGKIEELRTIRKIIRSLPKRF